MVPLITSTINNTPYFQTKKDIDGVSVHIYKQDVIETCILNAMDTLLNKIENDLMGKFYGIKPQ